MAEGLLELCELPVTASKLEKCHVCAIVHESYTIAQWLAHLPGKQNPGSNPGSAARHVSNLACKVNFRECKKTRHMVSKHFSTGTVK